MEKMKWGKVVWRTGILPELILCGGPAIMIADVNEGGMKGKHSGDLTRCQCFCAW